jgi:dipeptidyl aminopeptidase/acylaminoacyl peptidase
VAYVDALAKRGYVDFRPEYRGHGESEGSARGAYGSPDYVVDVLNALASVRQYPAVDAQRLGMWGHSMGGYITLRAMVVSPDIKAGVIWAGVVASYPDLMERWRRPTALGGASTPRPGGWRSLLQSVFGSPQENPEFWDSISANSYLNDLSGPVQLHHGTSDESVPYEFSQDLYRQLNEAGQTAEFYAYEGDNHNISNYFSEAMLRTIYFYDQYVMGEE